MFSQVLIVAMCCLKGHAGIGLGTVCVGFFELGFRVLPLGCDQTYASQKNCHSTCSPWC